MKLKPKQRHFEITLVIAIVVILLICTVLVKTFQQGKKSLNDLYVRNTYSTEGSYTNIEINNSKLIYTHTDYESIKDKCSQWIKQEPCWTEEDLKTEEVALSKSDVTELIDFITKSNFTSLEEYYGPQAGARCYSKIIIIKIKENFKKVNYCSGIESPKMPEEFRLILRELKDLLNKKFNTSF